MLVTTRNPNGRKRTRRGATLVLVACMLTVLMGFAALAIDFARMYTFKAQLKTLADAASLTAVYEMKIGRTEGDADTQAAALIANNQVDGTHSATMTNADIVPGTWNFNTRTFVASAWGNVATNSVRATTRYTASWTLAKIFGNSTRVLTETSISAMGSVSTSSCIKPFAVPYASLLAKAGYSSPYDMSTVLTSQDIIDITGSTAEIAFLNRDNPASNLPGNFGLLTFSGNDANSVAAAINGCVSSGVGVGSDVDGAPGNKWSANAVRDALSLLCGDAGGSGNCDLSKPAILVPIFDSGTGNGNSVTFHVKYIGAFKLTRYDNNSLYGYLTTLVATPSGGFSSAVGPVKSSAIVF